MRNVDNWLFGSRECSNSCNNTWNALDERSRHPLDDIAQEADQVNKMIQKSFEQIVIRNSCDVEVSTTDTKIAASLQAAIQAAIALVISVSIADSSKAETITQELLQKSKSVQVNHQQTVIENSKGVRVATTDTDVTLNIQLLIQLLIALVVSVDIL
ncbi:spore coat protein [Sutcliffiella rhizosphaerae]|uniref:Spore coat protein X n=1 Tax=Sutcliffiella rhizosphaerae TaxID=2880967 RepID=A0ABM8YPE2_9BACI|nr:spore coat protein [Sutcliffiella rhizosphaerae]CAG9621664.1 Spore coat protein X [Sutcliffiella rhizosphaerae]